MDCIEVVFGLFLVGETRMHIRVVWSRKLEMMENHERTRIVAMWQMIYRSETLLNKFLDWAVRKLETDR